MNMRLMLAPDAGSPLGRSRARVLDLLRDADGPLGVQAVADGSGLHPNTVRFHLDGLVDAGLATREPQSRAAPGRPSMAYRAAAGPAAGRRYRLLAEMLTSLIARTMPEPGGAAAAAGREWGAYLAEQPPPYQRPAAGEAVGQLAAIMEELGFAPQVLPEGREYRLNLGGCPFREVAQHHQDVVCSLHLGLMQGALAQMRAPVTADRLEPFTEPSLCVAHLTGPEEPGPRPQPGDRGQPG
jgi:predicted ArsR family transcriptional regulator